MSAKLSLRLLQFVLSVVLFLYSAQLVVEQLHAPHHHSAFFALLTLGLVEAVAALVFLFSVSIGGALLLTTIAVAVVLHVLHGQLWHIGTLLIYAAAVIAVMSGKRG